MQNGAAVAMPLEPLSTPASSTEIVIGKAAAAAVVAIAMAIDDYRAGGAMTSGTRAWTGGMLGHLAELRLAHLGDPQDFTAIVRREGKRALYARPDGVLLARLGKPCQVDAAIDELIGFVVDISEKVCRDELLRAN